MTGTDVRHFLGGANQIGVELPPGHPFGDEPLVLVADGGGGASHRAGRHDLEDPSGVIRLSTAVDGAWCPGHCAMTRGAVIEILIDACALRLCKAAVAQTSTNDRSRFMTSSCSSRTCTSRRIAGAASMLRSDVRLRRDRGPSVASASHGPITCDANADACACSMRSRSRPHQGPDARGVITLEPSAFGAEPMHARRRVCTAR